MKYTGSGPGWGALALIVACQSPVNTIERENPRAEPTVVQTEKVVFAENLAARLALESTIETTREGLLVVQANLRNLRDSTLGIRYKFEWFDADGLVLPTPTSTWVPRLVQGGEDVPLVGVAPSPHAVDFKLRLQED